MGRFSLAASVLALCVVGCDRSQLLEPGVDAAFTSAAGSTVKAPSNASAIAVSESQIDLAWQDNSTNETGFEVHRSTTGPSGVFSLLASTGAGATTYSNSGLSPSTQYCYEIRAFRTTGNTTSYSSFSITACATTLAPPAPGTIQVTTSTTGFDLDVNGYYVFVDDRSDWEIGTNATITIGVAAGSSTLTLGHVATNCSVDVNPRTVSVGSSATTEVRFVVTCGSGPAIEVTTVTTGVDLDTDGYSVMAWRLLDSWGSRLLEASASIAANGAVRLFGLTTGDYQVEFSGIAANCVPISPNPLPVDLTSWGIVAVEFDVSCGAIQPGTEVCDNGLDDDGDGLIDSDDPDCQLFCPYGDCFADACGPGYICGYDGCCTPHCNDGVVDGSESDVDCGGYCLSCAAGKYCGSNFDCASGVCVNNICQ